MKSLLNLIFPKKCVFCGRILERGQEYVCGACIDELPFTEGARSIKHGDFFDLCAAPFYYRGRVRESVLRYKFGGKSSYAAAYAGFIYDCIRQNVKSTDFDIITWVPVSRKRFRERGYDQAELLAEKIAGMFGKKAERTLSKVKNNAPQSGIDKPERRRANVLGAYRAHDPELVKEKRILLIDDVITTGSTMSECARTLLMTGAEEIVCAALARGE